MSGYVMWTKGYGREYELVGQTLNQASNAERQRFVANLRTGGMGLMDAHADAFFAGRTPAGLADVADRWFGTNGGPMWLWDCTLTPGQIHQVMRESRARTVELLLAGAPSVSLWVQCGHPRFRTVITWPGASDDDAAPATAGVWQPSTKPSGAVHVWVFTPYNAGHAKAPSHEARTEALLRLSSLSDLVQRGKPPREVMTYDDVKVISDGFPEGDPVWRNTPLAVAAGDPLPDPAGLQISFRTNLTEPFLNPAGYPPLDTPERIVSGIELSWAGAGKGNFVAAEAGYQPVP
jgi:hypothetical protein